MEWSHFAKRLRNFRLVSKKGADGTVEYWRLQPSEKKSFDGARYLEIETLLKMRAYRLMSLEESLKFREEHPDYVLPSRFVDRWKGTDDKSVLAKSRLVILGFKDPMVLQLERSAPYAYE